MKIPSNDEPEQFVPESVAKRMVNETARPSSCRVPAAPWQPRRRSQKTDPSPGISIISSAPAKAPDRAIGFHCV